MHKSVLLNETIEGLNIKETGNYVDATLGYAGHSMEILKRLKRGFLFAYDADIEAINISKKKLNQIGTNYQIFHANFRNLKKDLGNKLIDGFLFDLGVSSVQIDKAERGFSFMHDGPLDMRMNQNDELTAEFIINNYSLEQLTEIFRKYGEEKKSYLIAKKITMKRPLKTTLQLVEVIKDAVGVKYFFHNHPERQIFQAIRIEVNQELKSIEKALEDAIELLNVEGRICVITFHSLEDRIVKNIFRKLSKEDEVTKGDPHITNNLLPKIKIITKKPIVPSKKEIEDNSRSKSAKLRIVERIR